MKTIGPAHRSASVTSGTKCSVQANMWNFLDGVDRPAKRTKTVDAAAAEAGENSLSSLMLIDSQLTRTDCPQTLSPPASSHS